VQYKRFFKEVIKIVISFKNQKTILDYNYFESRTIRRAVNGGSCRNLFFNMKKGGKDNEENP
jgi:hypothetical protein